MNNWLPWVLLAASCPLLFIDCTAEEQNAILSVNSDFEPIRTPLNGGASMQELVISAGYPLEEYKVVTEDGYILTVFRIPHGKNSTSTTPRPLLLQHGIFATSTCWVISEPQKGLGFILADAGFDVWLSNSRGNSYSMNHTKFNPEVDKEAFFNYSFHEMGYYDLPAVVDFMLLKTGRSQVVYVGHSQGTTEFFAMLATRPEYNAKVQIAATMAPIAFFNHVRGTVEILTAFNGELAEIARRLRCYNILTDGPLMHRVDTLLCQKSSPTMDLCDNVLFALTGFDAPQFNKSLMPLIADQGPSGASLKQLTHYGQLAENGGKFAMFDYGKAGNVAHYGRETPPEYDLKSVSVPINLHYSMNDWLAAVEDVRKLHGQLSRSSMVLVPYPSFNHLDFMWAKDVRVLLYDTMINMLKRACELSK